MPEKTKHRSAQIGTYATMIVGLLFLFLVVSQAGKYQKEGAVVTSAKERSTLMQARQSTLLKIGVKPVDPQQNPLAGMPAGVERSTVRTGRQEAHVVAQTRRHEIQEETTDMQRTLERALERSRRAAQQEAQSRPTPQPELTAQAKPTPVQEETSSSATAETKTRKYTIRPNETLYSIALKVYGNGNRWREILKANPDLNPNRMVPGKKLTVPQPDKPSAAYRRWATSNEG